MIKSLLILLAFLPFFSTAHAGINNEFENLYDIIEREYVEDFDAEKFSFAALDGLSDIDNNIKITARLKDFYFYYGKNIIKIFPKPLENSISSWAALTAEIAEFAKSRSENLKLKDFMIFDVMAEHGFTTLDKYSKYYPSLEDADNIKIQKYFGSRMIGDILYIKLKTFNKLTFKKLKDELLKNQFARALILDLRGNKGGLISEALKIADLFLEKGSVIVSTKSKNNDSTHLYTAQTADIWQDKPIIVLVDGETASSAEILSAALKEQHRALLIGSQTFGKGTVQSLKILSEDKGFSLTNTYYFTPSDISVNKIGIEPDICLAKSENGCLKQNREKIDTDIDEALKQIEQYL